VSREAERQLYGLIGDHAMFDWAGMLAADRDSPDLVCAEFLVTDTIQHHAGYKSALGNWAIEQADLAVGKVLERLRAAGVEEEWNIAVMSDHGHSAIEHAIHPRVIVPDTTFQCEGQILLVAVERDCDATEIAARLAEHGVDPYPDTCVPPDSRGPVRLFVAPDGYSFEDSAESVTEPIGKPGSISSHGLRPGRPGDDRFALFAGPQVPHGMIAEADAVQVMPTLAKILGLPVSALAEPVF
jgi:predicted AlkP superfamily pyrophosphatase or phosphodiesterase